MSCVSGVIKMKDVLDALLSFAAGDLRTEQWLSKEEQQEYVMARKHRGQQWDELDAAGGGTKTHFEGLWGKLVDV